MKVIVDYIKTKHTLRTNPFLMFPNAAIAERADVDIEEEAKPTFPDIDNDKNTTELNAKSFKDKKEKAGGKEKKKDLSKASTVEKAH